jgi:hypothetical protein
MPVGITCAEAQAGRRHTLVMAADVAGKEVARTPFDVTCGYVPALPALLRGAPLAAAAPGAPAGAPAPIPVIGPGLSGSTSVAQAGNPAAAQAVAPGNAPAPVGVMAPDESTEPASNMVRMVGAGLAFAAFGALEVRRRSRRAYAKARR